MRGHLNLGTQIKMYPAPTTTPTHLMINDSSLKQRFYSFRDEIGQPRSFSAAGIAYTLTVCTVKMGVYIQWKLKSNCSLGIGMIRFYKVTIQSAHFCRHYSLVYREQRPAGSQQRRNWGCLLIYCFLLVSSMLSLPIPFLLCSGDGSIYEILRDPAIQGI